MTLVLLTWCPDPHTVAPCATMPCQPSPPPNGGGGNGGTGLPPFTDAAININQIQVNTDLRGNTTNYALGSMIIYSAIDNIPPQGQFGAPLPIGPPATSSIASSVVVYRSFITIRHPYYPPGSYNDSLPDVTSTLLTPTVSAGDNSGTLNQTASTAAGNAAIAQANKVLGNP